MKSSIKLSNLLVGMNSLGKNKSKFLKLFIKDKENLLHGQKRT